MRVAIIEDDKGDQEHLQAIMEASAKKNGIAIETDVYETGEAFRRGFKAGKYAILFFDNYIGRTLGIDLARKARELDANVAFVFVTMTPDFAVDGYELRTLHYLMKPVTLAGLDEAFRRWKESQPSFRPVLELLSDREPVKVALESIEYLEVFSNNCLLHCTDKEVIKVYSSLDSLMELLPLAEFLRPHRSFAIHLPCVARLEDLAFVMKSGAEIPISRRIAAECKRKYIKYLTS
ncbi:MAG: response regulator transcription factor [Schwartzia sp.]|nr:response regulator transcription factor [Schwartzia sp. (in: firmicutes)]